MSYFEINGARVTGDVIAGGLVIPYGNLLVWPDADLAAHGISKHEDPPASPAIPETISDRQFFQGLALKSKITNQEALDAVKTGTVPAILQNAISTMTGGDAFNAEMLLAGATQFNRSHPLTNQLGQALGYAPTDLDDFWTFASDL